MTTLAPFAVSNQGDRQDAKDAKVGREKRGTKIEDRR